MSEALSSSEIEDVLSSIRRLVSDDMRPAPKAAAAAVADGEKLLLTPSLRVVQADPQPTAPPMEEVLLSVSASVSQQADDWESETGDPAPLAEADAGISPEAELQNWEDQQIDAYVEGATAQDFQEILVAEAEEEPADTAQILSFAEASQEAAQAAPLPGWAQSDGADEAEDIHADPWVDATIEPDRAWADQAEADVLQELAGAAPRRHDADEIILNEAEAPEIPVDEAMLREIVREVLREELQGRLGERITRNIRKLVRAEIARVMASEEFM